MPLALEQVMKELAAVRPIFHSEADFQHAFAWQMQRNHPDWHVRLEYPLNCEDVGQVHRFHIDIWLRSESHRIAIELKYLTAALECTKQGESFRLTNQSARDCRQYDVFRDVERLEKIVDAEQADLAAAIVLTNEKWFWQLWSPGAQTNDALFYIHQGRTANGMLKWGVKAGAGTTKGRRAELTLKGQYNLAWRDYSQLPEGGNCKFKYLLLEIPKP